MRRAASRRRGSAALRLRRWRRGWVRLEPVEVRRGGALQVWLPRFAGKEYLVAVDTAGGGADGDFAAVQVIDLESGMQCAELQQRLGTLELARAAAELAREYGGAIDCGGEE